MRPILELEELYYRYPGQESPALDGASLQLAPGLKVAVVGRNGSGKSTLFLHCNGILRPDAGTVKLDGQIVTYGRAALCELRRRVGIVFQNPDDQLFSASVAQDIAFGPLNLGMSDSEAGRKAREAAETCGIADLLERPTHALSMGQKTRAAIAGVLAMEPTLLLVDEATGSLDPWVRRDILALFGRLTKAGKTVVVATHDMNTARRWADLVVVMDGGRVIAAEPPERAFAQGILRDLANQMEL